MAALISATLLRTQPDRRLVALAADGSEPAFEALVERYRRPLQAYCRRLLLPSDVAEDVVQQALLSTWQTLRRGTEITDPRAWLYRVTHNTALNALRRSGYRYEELDDALQGAGAPDEDLERRTAVRQALAGLAGLPELQRQALLRTAVEGQSHEDVARALGISDGAVRGLVYRARATLRTAAAALTPGPLVVWAAGAGSRGAPMAERIGELVAGGGASVGVAAALTKGGATVATVGALAGGAVVVSGERETESATARPAASAPAARATASVPASASAAVRAAETVDPEARLHAAKAGAAAELRRVTERRRRGRGRGRGRGGDEGSTVSARTRDEDDDDVVAARPVVDRSGRSGSSGSGSSGSRDANDDDRSGSSGSGSSGSGTDDPPDTADDSSGSGSESSGPGSIGDSSGSGSIDDSSGSGSIADSSGSGGDLPRVDSSGSGSGKLPEPEDPEED